MATDRGLTEKQKRVLAAAVEIFAKKGYAAASTSEIAQQAHVAEGTIFRHYRTKKDLLLSIVSPALFKFAAPVMIKDLEWVLEAPYGNFAAFLRALARERFGFAQKNAAAVKILIQEAAYHPELQDMIKEVAGKRILPLMERAVLHFQERGEIRQLPVCTVLRLIVTTFVGYIFTRLLIAPEQTWDDQGEIETMVQFLVQGLAPQVGDGS